MRLIATAIALAVVVAAPSLADAGPGDAKEALRYADLLERFSMQCPHSTSRYVQQGRLGIEEYCAFKSGVRTGYYLLWDRSGEQWAVLGRYAGGKRSGRWLEFTKNGKQKTITYYFAGKLIVQVNAPEYARHT